VEVSTIERDLEEQGLPDGEWDVILIHHFLDRAMLASAPESLRPGGLLAFCQPTVRNLERHERPSRRYLLDEGEIGELAAASGLEPLMLDEGWRASGWHEGWFVGRR
jgi:tellurite methyltransferase